MSEDKLIACLNCFNCKVYVKDRIIKCNEGHFEENINVLVIYTPFDFECSEFDDRR